MNHHEGDPADTSTRVIHPPNPTIVRPSKFNMKVSLLKFFWRAKGWKRKC